MSNILFGVAVLILLGALAGAIWSVAVPDRRLWPPPSRGSWPYLLNWLGFYIVCGINLLLLLMYWNSWIFTNPLRFLVGVPLRSRGWKGSTATPTASIGRGCGGSCEGSIPPHLTRPPHRLDPDRQDVDVVILLVAYGRRIVAQ